MKHFNYVGYDLLGAKILTCTESKSYDFAPPICAPVSCGHPDHPTNGHVLTTSGAETFRHNVTYACDDGYEMPSGKRKKHFWVHLKLISTNLLKGIDSG